jgi:hypothetical protein
MATTTNRENSISFNSKILKKKEFIKELKEVLRERIEEAKFLRTLAETEGIIISGQPITF